MLSALMESWSERREPNSALWWQAHGEALLSCSVTCLCWRRWCSACPPLGHNKYILHRVIQIAKIGS